MGERGPRSLEGIPHRLWSLISLARHRLLLLDYDGTLAPFRVERDQARPLPGARAALERMSRSRHTTLAIVSGRPVAELDRLLGDLRVTRVGEHGWELRSPEGRRIRHRLPRDARRGLQAAWWHGLERGWGPHLERKRTAVVLHTRGLEAGQAHALEDECRTAWESLAARLPLGVTRVEGGIEMRALGRNKGTAVFALLREAPPASLPVYVGDDSTDEDAFEMLLDLGVGIRVGDPAHPSMATGRLPSCEAVVDFLEEWQIVTGGGPITP